MGLLERVPPYAALLLELVPPYDVRPLEMAPSHAEPLLEPALPLDTNLFRHSLHGGTAVGSGRCA